MKPDRARPFVPSRRRTADVLPFDGPTTIGFALRARHRLSTADRLALATVLRALPDPHGAAGRLVADLILEPLS